MDSNLHPDTQIRKPMFPSAGQAAGLYTCLEQTFITDARHEDRQHKQPHSSVQPAGRNPKYMGHDCSILIKLGYLAQSSRPPSLPLMSREASGICEALVGCQSNTRQAYQTAPPTLNQAAISALVGIRMYY